MTDVETKKELMNGLLSQPKRTNPKFFYDRRGSELFEEIVRLPEYYLGRTELEIFGKHVDEIAKLIGEAKVLIELGSGASVKTRAILDRLPRLRTYIPIDISGDFLMETAEKLENDYPRLRVRPLCADFTRLKTSELQDAIRETELAGRLVFFPGSTIGNLDPIDAARLMTKLRHALGERTKVLIGIDLLKERKVIESAYNDSNGVTRAFNLNVLRRINAELGTRIPEDNFEHRAFFNEMHSRVEMHLVARRDFEVTCVDGETSFNVRFKRGETVHTENSYKYSRGAIEELFRLAGFEREESWEDERKFFSVMLFAARSGRLSAPNKRVLH